MSITTALDALTADANRWEGVADELGGAGDAAAALWLPRSAFSFAGGDAAATYEAVRAHVESLLRGAQSEVVGAAAALRQVRATYEGTDDAARAALQATWSTE